MDVVHRVDADITIPVPKGLNVTFDPPTAPGAQRPAILLIIYIPETQPLTPLVNGGGTVHSCYGQSRGTAFRGEHLYHGARAGASSTW